MVLFAKSGIGKTSLLQAGCAPELEAQDFAPIFLRINRINDPILKLVVGMLRKEPLSRKQTSLICALILPQLCGKK